MSVEKKSVKNQRRPVPKECLWASWTMYFLPSYLVVIGQEVGLPEIYRNLSSWVPIKCNSMTLLVQLLYSLMNTDQWCSPRSNCLASRNREAVFCCLGLASSSTFAPRLCLEIKTLTWQFGRPTWSSLLTYLVVICVFTARCTLVQSAVLRSHVVCLSVRLSVCDVSELWWHRLEFFKNYFTIS